MVALTVVLRMPTRNANLKMSCACVSDGDAERGGESAGGGEVDEESSGKNGGPCAVAEDQKGGEGDPSAGPDGSGAGVDVGQSQAELTSHEVHGGEGHQGG